jgi:hypothetical protein
MKNSILTLLLGIMVPIMVSAQKDVARTGGNANISNYSVQQSSSAVESRTSYSAATTPVVATQAEVAVPQVVSGNSIVVSGGDLNKQVETGQTAVFKGGAVRTEQGGDEPGGSGELPDDLTNGNASSMTGGKPPVVCTLRDANGNPYDFNGYYGVHVLVYQNQNKAKRDLQKYMRKLSSEGYIGVDYYSHDFPYHLILGRFKEQEAAERYCMYLRMYFSCCYVVRIS